jgi:hypothetical protein
MYMLMIDPPNHDRRVDAVTEMCSVWEGSPEGRLLTPVCFVLLCALCWLLSSLADVLTQPGDTMNYLYDLGDQ